MIKQVVLSEQIKVDTDFINDYVENKKFDGIKFKKYYNYTGIDIENTLFENTNLSNNDYSERSFNVVEFKNCNLVGINFTEAYLENVVFRNCNLLYANFSGANLKCVKFEDCILDETSFNEIKWKELLFDKCKLKGTEFVKTKLKDLDLSSCDITDMALDINHIKGLIVNYNQAATISTILGITIKN